MSQMCDKVCGTTDYTFEVPEGVTAEDAAVALGATLVSQVLLSNGKRIMVVRISVGLLTSSISAQQLPAAIYTVQQAQAPMQHVSTVTNTIMKQPAKFDVRPIAEDIKAVAPIIGDSPLVKVVSRAAATINVFATVLQFYSAIRNAPTKETARVEKTKRKCCDAAHSAMDKAMAKAAQRFHDASYKTKTGAKRFYGKKRKRV